MTTTTIRNPGTLPAECAEPCTSCGAPADELCRTKDGRPNSNPHKARINAYIARMQAALTAATETPQPAPPPATRVKDDLAVQLAVLKVLLARVTGVDADLRAQAWHEFSVGDQVPAYLSDADRKTGANKLGRVGMSKPRENWKITDPDAFTAWVAQAHPQEIETRPVVRNSFVAAVMAKHKAAGCWIGAGGEAVDVPGITLETGRPVLSVSISEEADALVAAALASGRVRFDGEHLAIESSDQ